MSYIQGKGNVKNLVKRKWARGRKITFANQEFFIGLAAETGGGDLLGINLPLHHRVCFSVYDVPGVIGLIRKNCKPGGRVKIFGHIQIWKDLLREAYNALSLGLIKTGENEPGMIVIEEGSPRTMPYTVGIRGGDIIIGEE
ncbi:MAG: hypothetical protein LBK66_08520 [Spirochaetaceae bacterium]|jgi:hypothetical protein|nr:hypothetical protein [Spirochaetaceae bacterium]